MNDIVSREMKIMRDALTDIANGEINLDFVMSDPPDWHKAYSALQKLAREALETTERL